MTTTMESCVDLQNPPQVTLQERAQAQDNSSPAALPIAPENIRNGRPLAGDIDDDDTLARVRKKQRNAELCALSKTFGHIPNIPIFTKWDKRQNCCDAAVHRSTLAGICGTSREGAYSVAVSSLYKDDEDGGDVIIYTGTGGRKRWSDTVPTKRLFLGPHTEDQSWDHPSNKALIVSYLTGNPVRVIRSWKCPSQYAPVKGYRYDGLYRVAAYWSAKGQNDKMICRCRLERLPNQPPVPLRSVTFSTNRRRRRERLVSRLSRGPPPSTNSCDMLDETGFGVSLNRPNPSTTQLTGNTGGEPGELSNPQYRGTTPETSTGIDFNMGEVDLDVKETQTPQPRPASPEPGALPRYRWNPKRNELVRLTAPDQNLADLEGAEEGEGDQRGEDDSTLVSSEDFDMHANECMETVHFPDVGTTQLGPGASHELLESGLSVSEHQGDH